MAKRDLSPAHQRLVTKLRKQLVTTGQTYGQVGIKIKMSRAGVHHLVNGTGARLPNEATFDRLVRAIGGDPTAKTWKQAYSAACRSYGVKITTADAVTASNVNTPQRASRRAVAVSVPRVVGGKVAPSGLRRRGTGGVPPVILAVLLGVMLMSVLLAAGPRPVPDRASPDANGMWGAGMPTATDVAVIRGWPGETVPVYSKQSSRRVVDSMTGMESRTDSCYEPGAVVDSGGQPPEMQVPSGWVKVPLRNGEEYGWVEARFVQDADSLVRCWR
ncbi:hypothetical protein [Streptomyces sp. NPDC004763]